MEFRLRDLERSTAPRIAISGDVEGFESMVPNTRFTDLREVYVEGSGYFIKENDEFFVNCEIFATVEMPCAISLKPVEIEIEATLAEVFFFGNAPEDEDVIALGDEDVLDLDPYIWDAILSEIPMKVVHPDVKEYPTGDGWAVLTEEAYLEEKKSKEDPRLAKLKDFKFD